MGAKAQSPPAVAGPAGQVVGEGTVRLWGMSSAERLRRSLLRAGAAPEGSAAASVVLLRADWVLDESLVKALVARPATALVADDGEPVGAHVPAADAAEVALALASATLPSGFDGARLGPDALGGRYNVALRKRESPLLVRASPQAVAAIEKRLFGGSYKGVTDLVTKYVWPAPAMAVTRVCANLGATPNMVTLAGFVLVVAAFVLFWRGQFWPGLVCAWVMTFLDTVDGKLARVTLTSSKIGNVLDHGIDLIHPPFWWWAWLVGLAAVGFVIPGEGAVLAEIAAGYVLLRLQEGLFLQQFGMELHVWRRFDSRFRLVASRRNPNLILLTLALAVGRPDLGIVWVAAWTVATIAVHLVQIAQAYLARRDGPLVSWLASA